LNKKEVDVQVVWVPEVMDTDRRLRNSIVDSAGKRESSSLVSDFSVGPIFFLVGTALGYENPFRRRIG
jgi:hypothetical protein